MVVCRAGQWWSCEIDIILWNRVKTRREICCPNHLLSLHATGNESRLRDCPSNVAYLGQTTANAIDHSSTPTVTCWKRNGCKSQKWASGYCPFIGNPSDAPAFDFYVFGTSDTTKADIPPTRRARCRTTALRACFFLQNQDLLPQSLPFFFMPDKGKPPQPLPFRPGKNNTVSH